MQDRFDSYSVQESKGIDILLDMLPDGVNTAFGIAAEIFLVAWVILMIAMTMIEMRDSSSMDETSNQVSRSFQLSSWPFIVAIVLLLLAIPRGWPYGYYLFLRLLVCGVAIYGAVHAYHQRRTAWLSLLVGMAVLFNPLIPIHLSKSDWIYIDFIAAGALAIFTFIAQRTTKYPLRQYFSSDFAVLFGMFAIFVFGFFYVYFLLYVSKTLEPYLLDWVSEENAGGVSLLLVCAAGIGILGLGELIEDWTFMIRHRKKLPNEERDTITSIPSQVDGESMRPLVDDAIKTERAVHIKTKLGSEIDCRVLKHTASSFHAYCKQSGKLTWFDFNEIDRAGLTNEEISLPPGISLRLNY